MPRLIAVVVLLCSPGGAASAADITATLELVIDDFTSRFTPDPTDVYHVIADNTGNTDPVRVFDLSIPGNFVQGQPTDPVVRCGSALPLPEFFGTAFADTFFVNENATFSFVSPFVAPGTGVDDAMTLAGVYTNASDQFGPIVPGGGTAVIAVLSVPDGVVPALPDVLGTAVLFSSEGSEVVNVVRFVIPEPASALLAGFVIAGVLAGGNPCRLGKRPRR